MDDADQSSSDFGVDDGGRARSGELRRIGDRSWFSFCSVGLKPFRSAQTIAGYEIWDARIGGGGGRRLWFWENGRRPGDRPDCKGQQRATPGGTHPANGGHRSGEEGGGRAEESAT